MSINFQKSTWIDRIADNPNRRELTKVGESEGDSYIVERDDNPTVEGTPFNASTMNDLEDRISNITIDDATFSENGLFTLEEKTKLNGIQESATKNSITRGTLEPSGSSNGDIQRIIISRRG